ncbi:hypothetical protein SprV_0301103400 [Sparganum proliferum]
MLCPISRSGREPAAASVDSEMVMWGRLAEFLGWLQSRRSPRGVDVLGLASSREVCPGAAQLDLQVALVGVMFLFRAWLVSFLRVIGF